MLSKMAQQNNGGGGSGSASTGRRVPLSLSGAASSGGSGIPTRLHQNSSSNGRSSSPQNCTASKKNETIASAASGPFVSIKKINQHRSSTDSSGSNVASNVSKDEEKRSHNGVNKSNSHLQKTQIASAATANKEQVKSKEKNTEKDAIKTESKEQPASHQKETKIPTKTKQHNEADSKVIIDLDDDPVLVPVTNTTPTSERKSSRRAGAAGQKTPTKPVSLVVLKEQEQPTDVQKQTADVPKQAEVYPEPVAVPVAVDEVVAVAVGDVEMEPLAVDASPIRSVTVAQPAATSTPGRNLFGFLTSASKQSNEAELATQISNSPATAPVRTFTQISGRRSIRPISTLTPGKIGSYRCTDNSDLDNSSYTNTSMNATVGSEIPNSSSFSFSFFGRGRKRERTPPPLSGSQSTNDLAQDVDISPPKRARFELFSLNLASPFSVLRSRFSKTTISSPSSRRRLDKTPPAGEEEEQVEVQNVSGIVIQEEEPQQQLNQSVCNTEVTVGHEAGLETPKKNVSLESGVPQEQNQQQSKEINSESQTEVAVSDVASTDVETPSQSEGPNRSRCAIM